MVLKVLGSYLFVGILFRVIFSREIATMRDLTIYNLFTKPLTKGVFFEHTTLTFVALTYIYYPFFSIALIGKYWRITKTLKTKVDFLVEAGNMIKLNEKIKFLPNKNKKI